MKMHWSDDPALSDFVLVDIETTGGKLHLDDITEIALIHLCQGEVVARFQTFLKPRRSIPPWITRLTGITNAMVADAPRFAEVAEELASWFHNKVFVAHNARFDYGFIKAAFDSVGLDFKAPVMCTVKLSRALYPEHKRHGLDQIIARFGFECENRHRAMDDAELLWQFLQTALQQNTPTRVWGAIKQQLKLASLPAKLDPHILDDCPDTPGVYRFYNEQGQVIYVGKSITLRTRIISHFSVGRHNAKDLNIGEELAHIDWIACAGDLSAQLLEAKLIKQLRPKYNVRLKKRTKLWSFEPYQDEKGYLNLKLLSTDQLSAADLANRYGLYRSKKQALTALEKIVQQHQLCQRLSGLENKRSGACFSFQLKRCKGACCEQESAHHYNLRLKMALEPIREKAWPWAGALLVKEQQRECEQIHLIHQWCWLGTATDEHELNSLMESNQTDHQIELDVYKILVKFLLNPAKNMQLMPL
jgi:DNA polymerase-3 subunit epsilon